MLKFFYRLRRRRGVVLFAVIAMMTILITMATVAYFTTRTAYQTVVSNYDFSQMYISTTSVSDMVLDSLIGTTSQEGKKTNSGVNSVVTLNYFDDFKDGMKKLVTADTIGGKFVGVSSNISWANRDSLPAMLEECGSNPLIPGALDGVRVTITLQNKSNKNPDGTALSAGLTNYYFLCETVGFYRNNTVTVQDYIYSSVGQSTSDNPPMFDTFFTATAQRLQSGGQGHTDTRLVVINTDEINDNAYFQNKFTVFQFGDRSNIFKGGVRTTGGLYLQKIECDIPAPTADHRHDWIIGGDLAVTSANANDINLNGNVLYVKGDLIIGSDGLNLSAGSIYVEGNVYLAQGGAVAINITGDNGTTDKPGFYVKGDIVKVSDATSADTVSSTWPEGRNALLSLANQLDIKKGGANLTLSDLTIKQQFDIINAAAGTSLEPKADPTDFSVTGDFYQTKDKTNDSGTEASEMVWSTLKTKIESGKEDRSTNSYVYEMKEMPVQEVLKTEGDNANLKTYDYASYSSKQATVNKVLTLDFTGFSSSTVVTCDTPIPIGTIGEKQATITFSANGAETKDVGNCESFVLDLPYVDGGYRLEMIGNETTTSVKTKAGYWDGVNNKWVPDEYTDVKTIYVPFRDNRKTVINIHTPDAYNYNESGEVDKTKKKTENWTKVKTDDGTEVEIPKSMPIVLTPNFNDGSGTPVAGNKFNAFSWYPGKVLDGGAVDVQLVSENDSSKSAQGYLILDMANYIKEGADGDNTAVTLNGKTYSVGDFVEYDPDNYDRIETTSYVANGFERVGTLNQLGATSVGLRQVSDMNDLFDSGNDPKEEYDNKILLVSNKNLPGTAYTLNKWSTLFGYVYAPNGSYNTNNADQSMPVFGGMIVSDYIAKQSNFTYAQPDPNLILSLGTLTSHNSKTPPTGNPSSDFSFVRVEGSNYLG